MLFDKTGQLLDTYQANCLIMLLPLYISILLAICLVFSQGALFDFILENDEVFDNCPNIPGNKGIHDLADISEMVYDYHDGTIKASGNFTVIWEGVQPTDRIEIREELQKFQRGSWQPTPYTTSVKDYCAQQFDHSSKWYQFWTSNIPETEQLCLNNFGHTYHHHPFDVNTTLDFVVNIEGRYKVIATMEAYDEYNIKRPKTICFQIFGEFIKWK